jgi:aspartyl-tRNA(Asn)/glutamyl-tRNA(Gln) amidotransferase subunit A
MTRLLDNSLRALAAGLRAREFSALDLWREAKAAMDASESRLGAYKLRDDAGAERRAREADAAFAAGRDHGLLQGIPVSVKDIYGVPGLPIFSGTARELPAHWQEAGPLVKLLLDHHATITGKTNTVELAFGGVGMNAHWGTPRNPWDAKHHRVPGGSSSGAGVSLGQGSAVVALGTDTAGSIRIPASLTGNVGYKPTIDRWSTRGITPLSRHLDTPGLLARSVDDAFLAAGELDRRMFGDRPGAIARAKATDKLRIGVPKDHFWDGCEPSIAEGVRAAVKELERAGHRVSDVDFPEANTIREMFNAGGTTGVELLAFLRRDLPDWLGILDPNVGGRMNAVSQVAAVDYVTRMDLWQDLASRVLPRFDDVDVMIAPTIPIPPPRVDEIPDNDRYRHYNLLLLRNTHTANYLRLCALTIPVGLDTLGLPIGLQVMTAPLRDDLLFAAGLAIEKVLGTPRERIGLPPG